MKTVLNLTCLCLALAVPPGEAVVIAAQDLGRIPADLQPTTRYLSLPDEDPEGSAKVLNGHLNHLSRSVDVVQAAILDKKVMRIQIRDYGWKAELFEQLAEADPFFHVELLAAGRKVKALAPILSEGVVSQIAAGKELHHDCKKNLDYLVTYTRSKAPILRADWFFNQTAAAADRKPNYYDFLRVKNQKDFEALIGFDAKLAVDFGKTLRESVGVSGVTLQPRAIERQNTLGGAFWKTYDFKKAVDKSNPLRVLGQEIENHFDATEQYGHLPNGFWATALFNGKGELQATAPDFIASDGRSRSIDRRVHVNASCMRCHVNGGLQSIDGFVRNLAQSPLVLQSPDYEAAKKLQREYLRSMTSSFERDRSIFAEAVKEATGWEPKEYAEKYAAFWERYEDAKVNLEWAAKDLHVTSEVLKGVILKRIKQGNVDLRTGGVDLVLASLVRGSTFTIRQWEELYPFAQSLLRGERP